MTLQPAAVADARYSSPPMATTSRTGGRSSIAATVAAAVFGLLMIVPWQPEWTPHQLGYRDFSWIWALSEAFRHGRVFGRDFIFTAGPLGFLGPRGYIPATGPALWIGWSAIALTWSAVLWRQLSRSLPHPVARVVLFAVTVICAVVSCDAFFLSIPVLAAAIAVTAADRDGAPWDLLAISVLLAAGSLVKFSFLAGGVATVAMMTVWDIMRRRRPLVGLAYGAAVLIMWLACGQPLGAFAEFMRTSMQVSGGYTAAMSLDMGDRRVLLAVAAAVALVVAASVVIAIRRRTIGLGMVITVFFATWLLVAKASFVRFDSGHQLIAPLWAVTALPVLWTAIAAFDASAATMAIVGFGFAVCCVATELALRDAERPGLASTAVAVPARLYRSLRTMIMPRDALRQEATSFDAMRREAVAHDPLPKIDGTVDVYPDDLAVVLSHAFAYAPRPVPQSYTAYTPQLAELNAAHLRGRNAPENILFDIGPIDLRFSAMEDGSSWPEIWRHYSFAGDTGGFLWLRRRINGHPTPDPRPLPGITATIGTPFQVPDVACGGVMAEFGLRPTLLYRLKTLLWKGPSVVLRLSPGPGDRALIPAMTTVPFLISPVIETRRHFAEFMQRGFTADSAGRPRTAEVRVLAAKPERYFAPDFAVTFRSVAPIDACPPTQP